MKSVFIVLGLFISTAAFCKPYGMAGCGLGSLVFSSDTKGSQVLAATTNGTSYSQLFGITSGTSNCRDLEAKVALLPYVDVNKQQILADIAKGSGESLVGLGQMMGCGVEKQAQLDTWLKTNFETILNNSETPGASTEVIYNTVKSQPGLKDSCQIFG
ncbi:MAG: DUF3015 family protein [Deltaproteobacteria bacterium]|nr:DUF3015 family protein [Deltaproteobacteria bacterium]